MSTRPVRGLEHAAGKSPVRGLRRVRESVPYLPSYWPGFDLGRDVLGNGWLSPGYLTGGVFGYTLDRLRQPDPQPAGMMSEEEWLQHLAWARDLYDRNPVAQGILGHIVNFVGDMEVRFSLKGEAPGAISLGDNPVDPAVAAVTDAWEDWSGLSGWADWRQQECRLRAFRDGECWLRFFRGGADTDGLPQVRFGEPECVRTPRGMTAADGWGQGVRKDPDDPETELEYWFADPADHGLTGDRVPAESVVRLKVNADGVVKRGVSDFLPVRAMLQTVVKLLSNMGETTAALSRYLWITEDAPGVTRAASQALIDDGATHTEPVIYPPGWDGSSAGVQSVGVKQLVGPTIERTSNGTKVGAVPNAQSEAFIAVEQAILRAVCTRWQAPELMSGDASNNSFSSSLVAGGPFVRAVEARQLVVAGFVRRAAEAVLRFCVESGRLTAEQVARVKIDVVPPAVVIVDQLAQAQRFQILHELGLDEPTILQECGYEPKQAAANKKAWTKIFPEDAGGGLPGLGGPPDGGGGDDPRGPMSGLLGESEGQPPHPGLVFDRSRHRWVRPDTGEEHEPEGGAAAAGKEPPEVDPVVPADLDPDDLADEGITLLGDGSVEAHRENGRRWYRGPLVPRAASYGSGPRLVLYRLAEDDEGYLDETYWAREAEDARGYKEEGRVLHRLEVEVPHGAVAGEDDIRDAAEAVGMATGSGDDPVRWLHDRGRKVKAELLSRGFVAAEFGDASPNGDYDHETLMFLAEPPASPAAPVRPKSFDESKANIPDGAELAGLVYVTEASGKRVPFTGRITDSLGRARCYSAGKAVPFASLGDDHAAAGARANAKRVLSDPASASPDDVRDLVNTLRGLTAEELKRVAAEYGVKHKGKVKQARVDALVAYAKAAPAKGAEPAPAPLRTRADGKPMLPTAGEVRDVPPADVDALVDAARRLGDPDLGAAIGALPAELGWPLSRVARAAVAARLAGRITWSSIEGSEGLTPEEHAGKLYTEPAPGSPEHVGRVRPAGKG